MKAFLDVPIPSVPSPQVCKDIDFVESPLVEIKETDKIKLSMQYPLLGFKNAESRCLLRQEAADMLNYAADLLPDGYKFIVWDAWRPLALQDELFYSYSEQIIKTFNLENLSEEEQKEEVNKFVAKPGKDKNFPPAHTTGGAVDVTIEGPDGNELDFGTEFDAFTDKTKTDYYENVDFEGDCSAEEFRNNRRMLYNIMIKAGFTNLPSEWWHYDYGDSNWGYIQKKPAIYDGIFEYR